MNDKTSKQVERELQKLLEKYKLTAKLSVKTIKDWIYNSPDTTVGEAVAIYQKKYLSYFSRVKIIEELNKIVQVFTDAWNNFPQTALGGKSPNQIFQSSSKTKNQSAGGKNKTMPKMIVGGREMEWDEYWAMLKEMERLQIPFKSWIEKDLLPKYKNFLSQKYGAKTMNKHYAVADLFFQRILQLGFLRLVEIRSDFIQQEFPHWWTTHVLMDSLTAKNVLSSLRKLFEFIELVYGISKIKFGFS